MDAEILAAITDTNFLLASIEFYLGVCAIGIPAIAGILTLFMWGSQLRGKDF